MLAVENISKVYQSGAGAATTALNDVTLTIEDGEFVAIMGPSGSGKSTLMHILGCLDSPSSGRYLLDGHDVSTLSSDDLADVRNARIGFVFQAFNLLPRATVLRNVMLPLVYSGISRAEREELAVQALAAADLHEDLWDHLSNELSGGQMQRVAIARALINDPTLVLADEPTGNLDTKTGDVILDTFRRLNEQGRTIVLITHERDIAEHARRVVHIQDGEVLSDERRDGERWAAR